MNANELREIVLIYQTPESAEERYLFSTKGVVPFHRRKFEALCEQQETEPIPAEVLLECLDEAYRRAEWKIVNPLIVVIGSCSNPSTRCLPLLCQIMDEFHREVHNEDLADVLGDFRDARALPALRRVIAGCVDEEKGGDSFWVPRKAIWSVGRIGGPHATEILRAALSHPSEEVRKGAAEELMRLE